MKKIFWLFILSLLISCGKEKLLDGAPSMVGIWIHYGAADEWEKVVVNADGTGQVQWYTNSKIHKETKTKDWFVKDNRLHLGKATFSLSPYDINEFPSTSTATVTEGFDTLTQGSRYCVMNNVYFVDKE